MYALCWYSAPWSNDDLPPAPAQLWALNLLQGYWVACYNSSLFVELKSLSTARLFIVSDVRSALIQLQSDVA